MILTSGSGTGKSTIIKSMCAKLNDIYSNTNAVQSTTLRIVTTGTAAFVIGGVTFHSILYLPVNRPLTPFYGISLTKLQEHVRSVKVVIICSQFTLGRRTWLLTLGFRNSL